MQKIVPHLWYNNQAQEAAKFYTSIFKNSKIGRSAYYTNAAAKMSGTVPGSVMTVEFQIAGLQFIALNGGPIFTFTPAVSFFVTCSKDEIDTIWNKLGKDGKGVLMELDKYPFAEKFGWLQDKYGLSWQVSVGEGAQKIAPCIMYVQKQAGKAEEAINKYISLFPNSKIIMISRYGAGGADKEGTINHAEFTLAGQVFMAMDSALDHQFGFNEAISLLVNCKDQQEIDYLWQKLMEYGEEGPCGWLKDKYGLSWQIAPEILAEMVLDRNRSEKVMEALLRMKKIDIKTLQKAYGGVKV